MFLAFSTLCLEHGRTHKNRTSVYAVPSLIYIVNHEWVCFYALILWPFYPCGTSFGSGLAAHDRYEYGSEEADRRVKRLGYCRMHMPSIPRTGSGWFRAMFETATSQPTFSIWSGALEASLGFDSWGVLCVHGYCYIGVPCFVSRLCGRRQRRARQCVRRAHKARTTEILLHELT